MKKGHLTKIWLSSKCGKGVTFRCYITMISAIVKEYQRAWDYWSWLLSMTDFWVNNFTYSSDEGQSTNVYHRRRAQRSNKSLDLTYPATSSHNRHLKVWLDAFNRPLSFVLIILQLIDYSRECVVHGHYYQYLLKFSLWTFKQIMMYSPRT